MGRRRHAAHGSLLVVTLWLTVIASMLAVAVARALSSEVRLTRYRMHRERAKMLARSGVALALQRLGGDQLEPVHGGTYDWLGDRDWALPGAIGGSGDPSLWEIQVPLAPVETASPSMGGLVGRVTIRMTDEERRLTLNPESKGPAFTEEVRKQLVAEGIADPIATAVLDYQDSDDEGLDTSVDPPYAPKNAPIRSLVELWQIPAIRSLREAEAELLWKTLDSHTTLYTDGVVNLNTADTAALSAAFEVGLVGQGASLAQDVIGFRWDPNDAGDPENGVRVVSLSLLASLPAPISSFPREGDLSLVTGGAAGSLLSVESNVFRIAVDGLVLETSTALGPPLAACHLEAVVRRHGTAQPLRHVGTQAFQILAWSER